MRATRTQQGVNTRSSMQKSHIAAVVLLVVALLNSVAAYVPPGKVDTAVRSDIPYIRQVLTETGCAHVLTFEICCQH